MMFVFEINYSYRFLLLAYNTFQVDLCSMTPNILPIIDVWLNVWQGSNNGGLILGQRIYFCEKNMEDGVFDEYRHVIYRWIRNWLYFLKIDVLGPVGLPYSIKNRINVKKWSFFAKAKGKMENHQLQKVIFLEIDMTYDENYFFHHSNIP